MFQLLKKAALPVAALAVVLTGAVAMAAQIEGGNFYRVKKITPPASSYADQTSADKCQTVQFLAQIHNPGPEPLENVKVKATLPTNAQNPISSKATISASNAATQEDTATVNLPAAYAIDYVAGSTKLLDHNAGVIQALPDGILGAGVDIPGGVGVSLQQIRYVQFQAEIDCPEVEVCPEGTTGTPPNCVKPPVTPPTTTTKTTPPAAPVTPSVIPSTGPEAVLAGIVGSGSLGFGVRQWLASRRRLSGTL